MNVQEHSLKQLKSKTFTICRSLKNVFEIVILNGLNCSYNITRNKFETSDIF